MFPAAQTTFGDTMYSRVMPDASWVFNFNDLKAAIEAIEADLVDVANSHHGEIAYDTVGVSMFFRNGDERIAEKVVCEGALNSIIGLIDKVQRSKTPNGGPIRIVWRTRPEFDVFEAPIVLKYDQDGPDIDHTTDRRCVKDHNWKLAKVYASLAVVSVDAHRRKSAHLSK